MQYVLNLYAAAAFLFVSQPWCGVGNVDGVMTGAAISVRYRCTAGRGRRVQHIQPESRWSMKMARARLALVVLCLTPLAGAGPACAAARSADAGGVATLSGQAFLTARGGEAVTCAGREVTALPDGREASPVSGAVVNKTSANNGPTDSTRHTLCDSQGHFVFTGLAPRDWTIRASIRWDVRAKQSIRHLGGDIVQHVTLRPGDNNVLLNDLDIEASSSD
jgi:hypothetical protein